MHSNPIDRPYLDAYSKCVLTVIALLLAAIAFRPILRPSVASAQVDERRIYIEPRTTTLRKPDGTAQMEGKVVVDLRTGNIWGFPTLTSAPYPVDTSRTEPPVSSPMYLGKFDFSKMTAPPEK
jgi:hypothetical protein